MDLNLRIFLFSSESKAEKSLLAKYGLNNYFLSVPIGLAIFVPLLEKGVSHQLKFWDDNA